MTESDLIRCPLCGIRVPARTIQKDLEQTVMVTDCDGHYITIIIRDSTLKPPEEYTRGE